MSLTAIPNGLTNAGYKAWRNLRDMGLLENTQAAMEYVVNTEFNSGITDSVMIEGSQGNYLFQGMTNRYQEYCKSGAWSTGCLNGFWAYHEGSLTGASATDYGTNGNATIGNIASAIQNPSVTFGNITAKSEWNGCSTGSTNICHYALPTTDLETWIRTYAAPYPDQYNPPSWSYHYAGSAQILYAWNNTDSLFVVMSQAMWDNFNLNNPTFLQGGEY